MDKKQKFRNRVSDNVKAGLLRWWIVGMCYFMIAFGTQLGAQADPFDLIFMLGVVIGLVTVVIYNPIAYSAFDIVKGGEIINNVRRKKSGAAKALDNLAEIGLSLIVVVLIYLTYENLNQLLVELFELSAETVVIAGEPFGFATLYILFHCAFTGIVDKIHTYSKRAKKSSNNSIEVC